MTEYQRTQIIARARPTCYCGQTMIVETCGPDIICWCEYCGRERDDITVTGDLVRALFGDQPWLPTLEPEHQFALA